MSSFLILMYVWEMGEKPREKLLLEHVPEASFGKPREICTKFVNVFSKGTSKNQVEWGANVQSNDK